MKIPLPTDIKTRVGETTKDARLKNAYVEVRSDQAVVRKRPCAQGGVSVTTGTAQGGIGFNIGGTDYLIGFWSDTLTAYTGGGTTWNSGTSYSIGDHVSVDFVDYWAESDNTNSQPPSGDWSRDYISSVPVPAYSTWGAVSGGFILSGGNLIATNNDIVAECLSSVSKSSGKWYCEILTTVAQIQYGLGLGIDNHLGGFVTANAGEIAGLAFDINSGTADYYINNVLSLSITFPAGSTAFVVATTDNTGAVATANFGASAFTYSPPSGYNSGFYI